MDTDGSREVAEAATLLPRGGFDAARAIQLLEMAADVGNPEAVYALAMCHARGSGLTQDDAAAAKLFERAAEMGWIEAYLNTAVSYEAGLGRAVDLELAVAWYRRGAESGNAECAYSLACLLGERDGLEFGNPESLGLFLQAAQAGHRDAQLALGLGYLRGVEIGPDRAQAQHWLSKAAAQGSARAKKALRNEGAAD